MITNLPFFGEVKKQVTTYNLHASSMIKMFSIYGIKVTTIFWGHNGGQNSQNGGVPVMAFLVVCEIFKASILHLLQVEHLNPEVKL